MDKAIMKILVIGHSRHGKDTVCEMLREHYGLEFISSSEYMAKTVVYPLLKGFYKSLDDCYNDRHNHRELWFNLIAHYNGDDKAKLSRQILNNYDIYCGLRNREELVAANELFDLKIWVNAFPRLPPEDPKSITVTMHDADIVIDNNGSLEDLKNNVLNLF